VEQNPYYSQCLPNSQVTTSAGKTTTTTTTTTTMKSTTSSTTVAAPPPPASSSPAVGALPCDIYAAGGTPCAAAHSTTRALYRSFNGALYQVQKASGAYMDIKTVGAGGIADSASQDSFCAGTTCVISQIYDQSPNGNHLGQATGYWKGPGTNGYDKFASATGAPIYLNGKKVYGVYIAPGYGYRRSNCKGTVTGNNAEGAYDVIDGTHYNQWCCFDYGNSETSATDTGNGHMMAIYFGDSTQWDSGAGSGPWIMADLENGMYSG
jgi:non-reducing end alpha-L-arabinofuranosidase